MGNGEREADTGADKAGAREADAVFGGDGAREAGSAACDECGEAPCAICRAGFRGLYEGKRGVPAVPEAWW